VTATGSRTIYRVGWQFTDIKVLDEVYVPFFGALGAAWDDAHGRPLERQSRRHALAGNERSVCDFRWRNGTRRP
jgi:hypothetical protein